MECGPQLENKISWIPHSGRYILRESTVSIQFLRGLRHSGGRGEAAPRAGPRRPSWPRGRYSEGPVGARTPLFRSQIPSCKRSPMIICSHPTIFRDPGSTFFPRERFLTSPGGRRHVQEPTDQTPRMPNPQSATGVPQQGCWSGSASQSRDFLADAPLFHRTLTVRPTASPAHTVGLTIGYLARNAIHSVKCTVNRILNEVFWCNRPCFFAGGCWAALCVRRAAALPQVGGSGDRALALPRAMDRYQGSDSHHWGTCFRNQASGRVFCWSRVGSGGPRLLARTIGFAGSSSTGRSHKKNRRAGRIEKLWGRRPEIREIEEPEIKTEGVRIKKLWSRWGRFASPGRVMDGS